MILYSHLFLYVNAQTEQSRRQYAGWETAARAMVSTQIQARGVKDTMVMNVMKNTPRHQFVPSDMAPYAYSDQPLPIREGQTISQPYIVGLMTELLDLKGKEKVLEIGTGSGYQAAILAPLVSKVYSIEVVKNLADSARLTLEKMGYDNVIVKWGDGYKGWPEQAPFDRIIVTAAPDKVPEALLKQLKKGGKLVIPVGTSYQELKVITKKNNSEFNENVVIPVRFVPMVHPNKPIPGED